MPGFTPFTSNYQDLSTNQGYQFEFRCDICGSGYRSEWQKNLLGTGASILGGASSVIGGLWGARNVADSAQQITDRDARDKALQKASNEIMPLFHRCVRCNKWVDETCFNKRGAFASAAPRTSRPRWRLSARPSRSTRCARRCRVSRSSRATPAPAPPNAPTAASRWAARSSAATAARPRRRQVQQVRRRARGRHSLLRQLRQQGRLAPVGPLATARRCGALRGPGGRPGRRLPGDGPADRAEAGAGRQRRAAADARRPADLRTGAAASGSSGGRGGGGGAAEHRGRSGAAAGRGEAERPPEASRRMRR